MTNFDGNKIFQKYSPYNFFDDKRNEAILEDLKAETFDEILRR